MRFDSTPYYHVGEPYYAIGWDALMSEVRQEAQLLEDAGFTTMWFAEHHFAWDGYYNAAPNPLLVAADLIPRTKTSAPRGPGHGPSPTGTRYTWRKTSPCWTG